MKIPVWCSPFQQQSPCSLSEDEFLKPPDHSDWQNIQEHWNCQVLTALPVPDLLRVRSHKRVRLFKVATLIYSCISPSSPLSLGSLSSFLSLMVLTLEPSLSFSSKWEQFCSVISTCHFRTSSKLIKGNNFNSKVL